MLLLNIATHIFSLRILMYQSNVKNCGDTQR